MNAGFLQFEPQLGDPDANVARLGQLLPQAAKADLVVLPELANSGYNFLSRQMAEDTAETDSGRFVQFLTQQAADLDCHIVSGYNERDGGQLFNSAVLVGPQGLIGKYRKQHLFVNEPDFFAPGNVGLPVFDLGFCRVGLLICFDWMFPEAWRILALKGADVICHPSNLVIPGLCQRAVPIHALINGVYTITANRTGTEGDLTFTGLSTIASPRGEVLAQATQAEEGVVVVDIDITRARDKMITPRNDRLTDRRPDCYSEICNSDWPTSS